MMTDFIYFLKVYYTFKIGSNIRLPYKIPSFGKILQWHCNFSSQKRSPVIESNYYKMTELRETLIVLLGQVKSPLFI